MSRRGPPQPASQRGGDDEALAFAEAMRDAKPLASAGRGPPLAAPAPASVAPSRRGRDARLGAEAYDAYDAYDASDATLAGSATFVVETFGGSIEGRAVGVDVKLLRRLKSGELPVDSRLDLHGHARAGALRALERFVERALDQGERCVLVIHGRGSHSRDDAPVLKPLVWRWLAASPPSASAVLAFASARPAQGGDGATLLLLRKRGR